MKIYFKDETIIVQADCKVLQSSLFEDFILAHKSQALILANSVIFLPSISLVSLREQFLRKLGELYISKCDFNSQFFVNTLLKLKLKTIRLDISGTCRKKVDIDISFISSHHINISLDTTGWLVEHFHEILKPYSIKTSYQSLMLYMKYDEVIKRLQKILNKKMLFGYELAYIYDDDFFDTISRDYLTYSFNNEDIAKKILESYIVLNCRIGSSKEVLKNKYKQLAKAYHPDRVFGMRCVKNYTDKFQRLQEAYTTLQSQPF